MSCSIVSSTQVSPSSRDLQENRSPNLRDLQGSPNLRDPRLEKRSLNPGAEKQTGVPTTGKGRSRDGARTSRSSREGRKAAGRTPAEKENKPEARTVTNDTSRRDVNKNAGNDITNDNTDATGSRGGRNSSGLMKLVSLSVKRRSEGRHGDTSRDGSVGKGGEGTTGSLEKSSDGSGEVGSEVRAGSVEISPSNQEGLSIFQRRVKSLVALPLNELKDKDMNPSNNASSETLPKPPSNFTRESLSKSAEEKEPAKQTKSSERRKSSEPKKSAQRLKSAELVVPPGGGSVGGTRTSTPDMILSDLRAHEEFEDSIVEEEAEGCHTDQQMARSIVRRSGKKIRSRTKMCGKCAGCRKKCGTCKVGKERVTTCNMYL